MSDISLQQLLVTNFGLLPSGYTGSRGADGTIGVDGYTGSKGDTGLGFSIAKSYSSVAALTADTSPTGIVTGQFAIIETGNVEDAENSRLYLWNGSAYSYVNDLSGNIGLTGPQGSAGYTGSAGTNGTTGYTGSAGINGIAAYTYGNTAPTSPKNGDLWFYGVTDTLLQYANVGLTSYWVDISGPVNNFGISSSVFTAVQDSASPIGQVTYATAGTYTWTAPSYVTKVCVVCVGGGASGPRNDGGGAQGGGGGGLGWKNNITVVPGQSYTIVVGAGGASTGSGTGNPGGDSYFINATTVKGGGGTVGTGGSYVGDGGGAGGDSAGWGGGGGAGGYSGKGGTGRGSGSSGTAGDPGTGGAGGGGGGDFVSYGGPGGGVGLYGQGANGAGGPASGGPGKGGSGGTDGSTTGGLYGGGGAPSKYSNSIAGGGGAVRIIWGYGRAFPSTLTTDQ